MRLLLIEDDESLCLSLSYQLRQDGFAPETCHDGEEGLLWARQQGYDLILLDRMLPGMDGLTLLRQLRREGIHTPVIFLTALGQLSDKTGGLDAGADDYIVKPFAYDELLARIRCVLRRPAVLSGGDLLRYGDVTYDPGSLTLRRGAASTALSKRLGDLLELFLRNPGQTLPRQTILLRVWGMETEVEDDVPTALMLLTVGLLIAASFLPEPAAGPLHTVYELRSGLVCMGLCLFGVARACLRAGSAKPLAHVLGELDCDTLLLLFGLFIVIAGIHAAGVIDAAARLFHAVAGESPFRLFTLLVVVSVVLSAFIDNIPYVAAMLPVVQSIAALMNDGVGVEPYVFYFGLLTGATLGGNLTPIGASANIAAIGILRKNGETVTTRDFLRIGVPFTLAAVLAGYAYLWLVWGKV